MGTDNAAAGTNDQGTGTGTAPATGTGTAQGPVTGAAQGSAPAPGTATPPAVDAAAHAKALKDLEKSQARVRELEQARMTDQEKRDARLAELEAERTTWELERQSLILRQEAFLAATAAGAMYPDLVVQAISPSSVEWSKDGKPTNLAAVIANAKKAYPAMFRVAPGSADGGAGSNGGAAAPSMNDAIRRAAGRG